MHFVHAKITCRPVNLRRQPRRRVDIICNAERIALYIADIERNAFAANSLVRDAVKRCLERVCEAAHRLGPNAADLMPQQPWPDIRVVGNWLRHAYDRISIDVPWQTVRSDVPILAVHARAAPARLQAGEDAKV